MSHIQEDVGSDIMRKFTFPLCIRKVHKLVSHLEIIAESALFKLLINPLKQSTKNNLGLYIFLDNSDSFFFFFNSKVYTWKLFIHLTDMYWTLTVLQELC